MSGHVHGHLAGRCCPDEPASSALAKLRANPPERFRNSKGKEVESEASWTARKAAWESAVDREQLAAKEEREASE